MASSRIPSNSFPTSNEEPTPVQPTCPRPTPELHEPSVGPTSAYDAAGKKWKPLIGTPSKLPVPGNILVPDPSPAQALSDSESSTTGPSTPGSFVHRRRQGEHVPRPPVWSIDNTDGTISIFPDPPPVRKYVNRKLGGHISFADVKIPGVPYKSADDVFMDEPLVVHMMQLTNLPGPGKSNSRRFSSSTGDGYRKNSPALPLPDVPPPDPSAEVISAHDPCLAEVNPTAICKGSTAGNRLSTVSAGPSTKAPSSGAASDQPRSTYTIYSLLEGPDRSGERLLDYSDLRYPPQEGGQGNPLGNKMVVGSVVVFVGRTTFVDHATGKSGDFELHLNKRYIVAEMYGDYWALLLKLEPGVQPGEREQLPFLGIKTKPKPPERRQNKISYIGLRRDPKFFAYAPLCAFTLASNPETPRSQAPSGASNNLGPGIRGFAQAALRSYSLEAEEEAEKERWIFVPKPVYYKYVDICNNRQRLSSVGNGPLLPSGAENCKPNRNIPRQNIKDFFRLGANMFDSSNKENNEPRQRPNSQPIYSIDTGFRHRSIIAASAPQLKLPALSASLEDLSLGSPVTSSDDPPGSSTANLQSNETTQPENDAGQQQGDATQQENVADEKQVDSTQQNSGTTQQNSETIQQEFRATQQQQGPMRLTRVASSETMFPEADPSTASSGKWVSSTDLALPPPVLPAGKAHMRTASDPTPRPRHQSPLTMHPSHVPADDIIADASATNKNTRKADRSTVARNAGETFGSIRKLPAIIESYCRSKAKKLSSEKHNGSTRRSLIEPCKNFALTLTGRKKSFVPQRKSILLQDTFKRPEPSSGPSIDHILRRPPISAGLIDNSEEQRQLRERLAAAKPLPTVWSSVSSGDRYGLGQDNAVTNAGEGSNVGEGFMSSVGVGSQETADATNNAGEPGWSDSPTLPRPGHLSDHLIGVTPEERIRERLNATPEQLVRQQELRHQENIRKMLK